MVVKKVWQVLFVFGFCLSSNLLFPGLALAEDENEGVIGGDYWGDIDEVTIHDTVLSGTEVLNTYDDMMFLVEKEGLAPTSTEENVAWIGGYNYKGLIDEVTVHDTVLTAEEILAKYQTTGLFISNTGLSDIDGNTVIKCAYDFKALCKFDFNITRPVTGLKIKLSIPEILKVSEPINLVKDGITIGSATIKNDVITINHALDLGKYKLEFNVSRNTSYSIYTEQFENVSSGEVQPYVCTPFTIEFVDLPWLL
ncbi:MAG: hypothetical protein PHI90_04780 [Clostridia bacterium]|nr:hypothetical protein [Clostridia bacterium]MDD4048128.1 hypothetical protein [Clostridia bacterium]